MSRRYASLADEAERLNRSRRANNVHAHSHPFEGPDLPDKGQLETYRYAREPPVPPNSLPPISNALYSDHNVPGRGDGPPAPSVTIYNTTRADNASHPQNELTIPGRGNGSFAPAPNVTIYNTTRLDDAGHSNGPVGQPDSKHRSRAGNARHRSGEWELEDEIAELRGEMLRSKDQSCQHLSVTPPVSQQLLHVPNGNLAFGFG